MIKMCSVCIKIRRFFAAMIRRRALQKTVAFFCLLLYDHSDFHNKDIQNSYPIYPGEIVKIGETPTSTVQFSPSLASKQGKFLSLLVTFPSVAATICHRGSRCPQWSIGPINSDELHQSPCVGSLYPYLYLLNRCLGN